VVYENRVSREIATQGHSYIGHSFCNQLYRPTRDIFPETRVIGLHYCHSNLCSRLQKTHLFCTGVRFGRSMSSKVDDFGINRKHVCDFLFVPHCDYGPILHRFWDTATYWLKIAYFSQPSHSAPSLPKFPLEFRVEVNQEETRVMGLSYGVERMIVAWVILTQCQHVTDGQTHGRTDGRTDLL